MFCGQCGERVQTNWRFCVFCGGPLKIEGNTESESPSKLKPETETAVKKEHTPAGKLENVIKNLTPDGKKSLDFLRSKYGKESTESVLIVQFVGSDRKVIRRIGGLPGKAKIKVPKKSSSDDWISTLKSCFKYQNFNMDDVFFVINKEDEKTKITVELLEMRRRKMHKKDLLVYAVLPKKRKNLVINYERAEEKKCAAAEVLSTATVTVSSEEDVKETSEEDSKEAQGSAADETQVEKSRVKKKLLATGSAADEPQSEKSHVKRKILATCSTADETQSNKSGVKRKILPTDLGAGKTQVEKSRVKRRILAMKTHSDTHSSEEDSSDDSMETKKHEPSEVFVDDWWTKNLETIKSDDSSCDVVPSITTAGGNASVSLSTSHTVASATKSEEIVAPSTSDAVVSCDIDDQNQAERDMERYFQLKERKEERQKMASLTIKGQQLGAKRISVVYCSHGGIGLSMSVPPETPLKFVFDYICSNIQAEVLPPKFVLKTSDDQEYKPTDNCACGDVPGLLFIKEEVYNFDDTLTNYDEVHFMSC